MNEDPSLKILGARIRRARKRLGLSQEQLALESDLDRSYMGGVERGERNLSFLKLCAIARVLKKDLPSLTRELPVS
ncbi:MAG TPA: helix-turn-helix transcriptional regulator [Chthoniobacteraceae bacterium]|nr:helix-turn-helix transcriptional regulator [Chthoniobacteraceae bacterium]